MFKTIKKWLGIKTEKPIKAEKPQPHYTVVGEDDPNLVAMLNAVMQSGKACVGTVDDDGKLTIKEINE